ncbi:hypothetical protein GQ53DRAFT_545854 [Thozetella sp. PMI_491]|nr:hypothetical protein GQ53DRAFT_545854 [Thozetella sp. PMI_491]
MARATRAPGPSPLPTPTWSMGRTELAGLCFSETPAFALARACSHPKSSIVIQTPRLARSRVVDGRVLSARHSSPDHIAAGMRSYRGIGPPRPFICDNSAGGCPWRDWCGGPLRLGDVIQDHDEAKPANEKARSEAPKAKCGGCITASAASFYPL